MNAKELIQEYGEIEAELSELSKEKAFLEIKMKSLNVRAKEIEDAIKKEMIAAGMKRARIEGWKINISKSVSTVIEEIDMIPDEFFKIKKEPDVMKIKLSIQMGLEIKGVVLRENKNISIKK